MSRALTVLFRRDPSLDRHKGAVHFEGYRPYWPDGQQVAVGLDAFCKHGQRLLGLGKHLAGCQEKLIRMLCFHLAAGDAPLNRLPGHRVRRFYIERQGEIGRIHFMDGTPTTISFEVGRDETRVLVWFGLLDLADGERQWFDLAATTLDSQLTLPIVHNLTSGHNGMSAHPRLVACEA